MSKIININDPNKKPIKTKQDIIFDNIRKKLEFLSQRHLIADLGRNCLVFILGLNKNNKVIVEEIIGIGGFNEKIARNYQTRFQNADEHPYRSLVKTFNEADRRMIHKSRSYYCALYREILRRSGS